MTEQAEQTTTVTIPQDVIPPQIESEVDIPFGTSSTLYSDSRQVHLTSTDSLDDEIT